jgi:hypothetical protein
VHALHFPPRNLWRVTALAALLTLAVTLLLLAVPQRLSPDSGSRATPVTGAPAPAAAPQPRPAHDTPRPPLVRTPSWLSDPLRPPSLGRP